MQPSFQCSTCNEHVIPVDGVSAIWDRGYWWHASCCSVVFVNGKPHVDFPSNGQLISFTLMTASND